MTQESTRTRRTPALIIVTAALAGATLGLFEIANTSIGWHLASGDWILAHRAFLHSDPFSFTSGGAPWIDHEWLFQVGVAIAYSLGGAPALVALRALAIGVLAVMLLVIGVRSGLSPAAALLLSALCVVGARGRFFVRPELATLVIVPAAVWIFLRRQRYSSPLWLMALAGIMVIGANTHGGVLVVPPLLGGIVVAEAAQMACSRRWQPAMLGSGVGAVAVTVGALLVNPYGWHLLTVPFRLSHLVSLDHIPNPEWIMSSPARVPAFYTAVVATAVVLALRERRLAYWALFLIAAALAVRHIRNVGLFFVLLPVAVAPALATWSPLTAGGEPTTRDRRRARLLAVAAVAALVLAVVTSPRPRFGIGFAQDFYPDSACAFLDAEGLPQHQLYNDVRFGGYLIHRYGPRRQVFQDDRNEIHEPLLRRIWEIFRASDVSAWSEMLAGYDADTALVRYHPPITVTDPSGNLLGVRGFSVLWFPADTWALVYWDDIAMVFVRRQIAPAEWLHRHEYRVIRPDDLAELEQRVTVDAGFRAAVAHELERALHSGGGQRANAILNLLR